MPAITTAYQPEKLNLWDRIFNRYKEIPIEMGNSSWSRAIDGVILENTKYVRTFVVYHIVGPLTGGYTIDKRYSD